MFVLNKVYRFYSQNLRQFSLKISTSCQDEDRFISLLKHLSLIKSGDFVQVVSDFGNMTDNMEHVPKLQHESVNREVAVRRQQRDSVHLSTRRTNAQRFHPLKPEKVKRESVSVVVLCVSAGQTRRITLFIVFGYEQTNESMDRFSLQMFIFKKHVSIIIMVMFLIRTLKQIMIQR